MVTSVFSNSYSNLNLTHWKKNIYHDKTKLYNNKAVSHSYVFKNLKQHGSKVWESINDKCSHVSVSRTQSL